MGQVWLQLELASGAALKHVRKLVSKSGPDGEGPASLIRPELQGQIDDIIVEDEDGGGDADEGGDVGQEEEDEDEDEDEDAQDDDEVFSILCALKVSSGVNG